MGAMVVVCGVCPVIMGTVLCMHPISADKITHPCPVPSARCNDQHLGFAMHCGTEYLPCSISAVLGVVSKHCVQETNAEQQPAVAPATTDATGYDLAVIKSSITVKLCHGSCSPSSSEAASDGAGDLQPAVTLAPSRHPLILARSDDVLNTDMSSTSTKHAHTASTLEIASTASCTAGEDADGCVPDQQDSHSSTASTWQQQLKMKAKQQAAAWAIGLVAAAYNLTIIYSAYFINAYLVQLITMFVPVLVAVASTHLLRQRRPPGLYVTLLIALGGSAMVIAGEWLERSKQLGADSTASKQAAHSLIVGVVLSVVTVLLSSAYMLSLQVFRTVTTSEQVLITNRNCSLLLFLPLALGVESTGWRWLHMMRPGDWGVLVFCAVVIYTMNTYWLQVCTRRIGASMFSVFVSLRLVASVVGSAVLLQDTPQSPITWAGFALVLAVMTAFLVYQQRHGRQTAPPDPLANDIGTMHDQTLTCGSRQCCRWGLLVR